MPILCCVGLKKDCSKDSAKPQNKGFVILPYIKGTSETLKRTLQNYGIKVVFKPTQTLRQYLVSPKDKTDKKDITGAVYHIPCQGITTRVNVKKLTLVKPREM